MENTFVSRVKYTESLRKEYSTLFSSMEIREEWQYLIDRICNNILQNRSRYENSVKGTSIPWQIVAITHQMECNADFNRQIFNGQRIDSVTTIVPKGLGPWGSWEESTRDALEYHKWTQIEEWNIEQILYRLEEWNGWGYRLYSGIFTPYLWSGTQHYISGKYIRDGRYDKNAVSKQLGAAVTLWKIWDQNRYNKEVEELPVLRYSNAVIPKGKELQVFLNSLEGISLKVDGWPGLKTSEAFRSVFGFYLKGDPREQ